MGGATTTCEALWMGTPVISLGGEGVPSRMAASLLCDAHGLANSLETAYTEMFEW